MQRRTTGIRPRPRTQMGRLPSCAGDVMRSLSSRESVSVVDHDVSARLCGVKELMQAKLVEHAHGPQLCFLVEVTVGSRLQRGSVNPSSELNPCIPAHADTRVPFSVRLFTSTLPTTIRVTRLTSSSSLKCQAPPQSPSHVTRHLTANARFLPSTVKRCRYTDWGADVRFTANTGRLKSQIMNLEISPV
ncbi:hypothetical protein F2P81_024393 [Scophthalmus maximus]|uniref:Uncharacterized protein n=1 Tax=Scophthalmus maximus TaxID=52904 RepID=A0A6A4RPD4_SCOMX|nr:hypothetical protein F2P81_024393 [Scophthalmus maximus]